MTDLSAQPPAKLPAEPPEQTWNGNDNDQDGSDKPLAAIAEFRDRVDELRQVLAQSPTPAFPQLPKLVEQLGTAYRSQVLTLDWSHQPAAQRSRIQSAQVEMHKQLRLVTTDLMFLKAAKQAEVRERRAQTVGDRLTNLQGYCDAILKLAEGANASSNVNGSAAE